MSFDVRDEIVDGSCIDLMQGLPESSVDLVIADPPYNLSKGGAWQWDRSVKLPGMGGKWAKAMESWDDIELADYFEFSYSWLREARRVLRPTGSMWVFGTYHNIGIVNVACQALSIEIINEIVWYKRNSFPNLSARRLTASHETILWCHKAATKKREYYFDYENSRQGDYDYDTLKHRGKQMRTVWDIPNNKQPEEIKFGKHPTQKPLRVIKRMIALSTRPGDLVLAPFSGSGTECVAAKELGRHYLGFETEPQYAELARMRLFHAHTSLQDDLFGREP